MLEELHIADLGVIEDATVRLAPGFTALTGETGAGKTMVINALQLLLGVRADGGAVRVGRETATVEGVWTVSSDELRSRVEDLGGRIDDDALILSRSVSKSGRSRAHIGGRAVPVGALSDIGTEIVAIHGQSEQLRLKSQRARRELLDLFAGAAVDEVAHQYRAVYQAWQESQRELESLKRSAHEHATEAAAIRAMLEDLEKASPTEGEIVSLKASIARLDNLEGLRIAATGAHALLVGSDDGDDVRDALSLVGEAAKQVESVSGQDAELAAISESIDSVKYQLGDVVVELASYLTSLEGSDASTLEAAQERLATLTALERKYSEPLDEQLRSSKSRAARLYDLEHSDERIEQLGVATADAHDRCVVAAGALHDARAAAAVAFGDRVTSELGALAMAGASLGILVAQTGVLGPDGDDEVDFLLTPHAGAEATSIVKGASGGELSRIMLAIEVSMAEHHSVDTFVFDEIDAGIGGSTAIEIGKRLAELARRAQVIVITHLAQVAAFADRQLRIEKRDLEGADAGVATTVEVLEAAERVDELARMLGGIAESRNARAHAVELLEVAADAASTAR